MYCPFPGYIDHGKVLLVGNMGLYDYRPYVRKVNITKQCNYYCFYGKSVKFYLDNYVFQVVNNKQIMYDCDKGYVLLEGPPGATCIGGQWSPRELPR